MTAGASRGSVGIEVSTVTSSMSAARWSGDNETVPCGGRDGGGIASSARGVIAGGATCAVAVAGAAALARATVESTHARIVAV